MSFDIDVEKRLGDTLIVSRFSTGAGLTVLFGPSGAGKSTILNMVAGLLRPDRGHVRVNGETLFDASENTSTPPERRHAGYIFQDARLFPHLRVRDNLLYGHRLAAPGARWLGLDETVSFLGIGDLLARWPHSLSGGEARRIAIGRALLSGARFLLMDEPLSSLDQRRREDILRVIERIHDELRLPILYVTHDEAEAKRLGSAIIAV